MRKIGSFRISSSYLEAEFVNVNFGCCKHVLPYAFPHCRTSRTNSESEQPATWCMQIIAVEILNVILQKLYPQLSRKRFVPELAFSSMVPTPGFRLIQNRKTCAKHRSRRIQTSASPSLDSVRYFYSDLVRRAGAAR